MTRIAHHVLQCDGCGEIQESKYEFIPKNWRLDKAPKFNKQTGTYYMVYVHYCKTCNMIKDIIE